MTRQPKDQSHYEVDEEGDDGTIRLSKASQTVIGMVLLILSFTSGAIGWWITERDKTVQLQNEVTRLKETLDDLKMTHQNIDVRLAELNNSMIKNAQEIAAIIAVDTRHDSSLASLTAFINQIKDENSDEMIAISRDVGEIKAELNGLSARLDNTENTTQHKIK